MRGKKVGDSELSLLFTERVGVGNLIQGDLARDMSEEILGLSDTDGKVRKIVVGYSDSYLIGTFSASNKDHHRKNCGEHSQVHWTPSAFYIASLDWPSSDGNVDGIAVGILYSGLRLVRPILDVPRRAKLLA
jgi:hypothetical protein